MMEVATATAMKYQDDVDIPFVQAVYADGELTEVPPDLVMVHAVSADDNEVTAVALAIEVRTTLRRSSSNSNTTNVTRHEEDTFRVSVSSSLLHEDDVVTRTSIQQEHQDRNESRDLSSTSSGDADAQVFGSGAAGAVLGLLVGGPLLAVMFGLGMLYHCQQEGVMGDVARALGDVALLTRSRFEELNEKHHLVDRGRHAAGNALNKIKETERRRSIRRCQKGAGVQRFVATCWKFLVAFENKHHFFSRVFTETKHHLNVLVEQCVSSEHTMNDSNEQVNNQAQR